MELGHPTLTLSSVIDTKKIIKKKSLENILECPSTAYLLNFFSTRLQKQNLKMQYSLKSQHWNVRL